MRSRSQACPCPLFRWSSSRQGSPAQPFPHQWRCFRHCPPAAAALVGGLLHAAEPGAPLPAGAPAAGAPPARARAVRPEAVAVAQEEVQGQGRKASGGRRPEGQGQQSHLPPGGGDEEGGLLRADDLLLRPHEEEADQQEERRRPVGLGDGAGDAAGDRKGAPQPSALPNAVAVVVLPSLPPPRPQPFEVALY